MAEQKQEFKDGTLDFSGGQDSGNTPSIIDANQYAASVNATARGGKIKPRPGLRRVPLNFGTNLQTTFQRGFFTHADFYPGPDGTSPALMTMISGRLFRTDLRTKVVSDITPQKSVTVTLLADFVIPAANGTIQISVSDTSQMFQELSSVTVAGYFFTLVSIDSSTLCTIQNVLTSQAGITVSNPVTTSNFTIPALYATVNVAINNTASLNYWVGKSVSIGGNSLAVVSVNSTVQITVKNLLSTPGTVVNSPAYIPAQLVIFKTYDVNNQNDQVGWSLTANNYFIYQNNQAFPMIYNGSASRRSDPSKNEVPVGNVMAYVNGRIAVALPTRNRYRVGDIDGGSSGTAALNYVDAILRFTENTFLNEGGDFVVRTFGAPTEAGPIYSMRATAQFDTQLGQGAMIVSCPNAHFTVNLPFDRTTWKNTVNPLQTIIPVKGFLSQRATIMVNADLWGRAPDGVRSLIMARREDQTWGHTAQSTEVGDAIDLDYIPWLESASAALFDNRLLMTVSPQPTANGMVHRGLVVLDFHLVSGLRKKLPPAWEGVWTGFPIFQIVYAQIDNVEHLYFYVLNANNHIELWEMDLNAFADDTGPINWSFESRSYTCGDSDQFKQLNAGRFVVEDLRGTLVWASKFKTDNSPCWIPWDNDSTCAASQDCGPPACPGPHTYREQTRRPINMRMPPDSFDSTDNTLDPTGYECQVRMELTGYGEIKELRIYMLSKPEPFRREAFPVDP